MKFQEVFDGFRLVLGRSRLRWLDAYHGGLKTNNAPHTVRIYFNPEKDISVEKRPHVPQPQPNVVGRADDIAKKVVKQIDTNVPLTQDGIVAAVAENFKKLMADEEGAIKWPFWRTDIRPDEIFRPDPLKASEAVDNVRAIFSPASLSPRAAGKARSIMAWTALDVERAVHSLNQYGRYVAELDTDQPLQHDRGLPARPHGHHREQS